MKQNYYYLIALLFIITFNLSSCSNENKDYVDVITELDLTKVPYAKLSEYKFFEGELKFQEPSERVIPYRPASELFSDYAHKKRFIWMPKGVKATYKSDDTVLDFPIGTVLIKTFYYNNVLPSNTTRILETRLLVRKTDGWKLYDYIWNDEQTEAVLDTEGNGVFVPISWKEGDLTKSATYKIPPQTECITCHKTNPNGTGEISIPIGPKPQNLNYIYNYGTSQQNQLEKLVSLGYIDNSLPELSTIKSTVDWKDTSKSLELRARSYLDINCAHCHREGGHCSYVPQRFNFSNTDMHTFGVCLEPITNVPGNPFVINAGNADRSELIYRMTSTEVSERMPVLGRTLVHDEGLQLIKDYINSLPTTCR